MSQIVALACAAGACLFGPPVLAKDRSESGTGVEERKNENATWSGEISASALRSGVSAQDEEYGGAGYNVGGEITFQQKLGDSRLRIEYQTDFRSYDDPDRNDQWRNRISGEYRIKIDNDVFAAAEAEFSTNRSGVEAREFDQTQAMATLEFRPGDHRVRLHAGWRWRSYDDGLGSKGDGLLVEMDYRYSLGSRNHIGAELRHEKIDSALSRYGYDRTRALAYYSHPLGSHTSVQVGAAYEWLQFDDRPIAGVGSESRKDTVFTPELVVLHQFEMGAFLRASTKYLIRESTDPDNDANSHRVALTAGYRF